ncbi:inorganic phosphate transporter [Nakamurella deserti]|uniref:inorganic phosphate transporter n=1 Tax=Nakamurella deserti TaxID=2164074 RepID=UPI000DBE8376|nr:inorganic phosphate transporter [Nakamurella deserti]
MSTTLFVVIVVVVTALMFDFTNGFHDSANAMATSVATGALKPRTAVLLAAVLNVVGAFLSTEVAKTISGGLVNESFVTPAMVFGGLVGAILWNLLTWLYGLPSSSSHALFGGLIGAVLVGAGTAGVNFSVVISKILLPAIVAPLVAGVAAGLATALAYRITGNQNKRTRRGFKSGQAVTGSLVALAHGTSDGQKTMGVITLVLITANYQDAGTDPQWWVILTAGLAIGLGTYSGGWRIMRTLGKGLADIEPAQGFAANASSTATILASSHLGFGLSTTHVCSGSVLGSGVGRAGGTVRWGTAGRMGLAWLLTLPAAAVVGGLAAWIAITGPVGVAIVLTLLVAGSAVIWVISRKTAVDRHNVNEMPEVEVLGEYRTKKERKRALKERQRQRQPSLTEHGGPS